MSFPPITAEPGYDNLDRTGFSYDDSALTTPPGARRARWRRVHTTRPTLLNVVAWGIAFDVHCTEFLAPWLPPSALSFRG